MDIRILILISWIYFADQAASVPLGHPSHRLQDTLPSEASGQLGWAAHPGGKHICLTRIESQ